jgi:hypothetical protein
MNHNTTLELETEMKGRWGIEWSSSLRDLPHSRNDIRKKNGGFWTNFCFKGKNQTCV